MSNKASDKNVATEDDVNELKRLLYSDTLTQYGKRKLVNYYEQRIQELEEESKILEFQNKQVENYAEELKKYNKTVSDRIVEYKKNSIPKQVVIDELKKLSDMLNKTTEGRIQKYTVNEIIIRSNALQELLEGGR